MTVHVPLLKPIIEGAAEGDTVFFIQGWPDDHTLWDEQVERLRDRYRCVRVEGGDRPRSRGISCG
jgi:pimeloyl-ACP methyl ester carboxylesterase